MGGWDCLSEDLTELILSYLPIPTLVRARTVCKLWRSIISSSSFTTQYDLSKKPWFFICGHHNIFSNGNQSQAFAFDFDSFDWLRLPPAQFSSAPSADIFFGGVGGYLFATASGFSYSPILGRVWHQTPPLRVSRCDPLVGVFTDGRGSRRFIVVGGVRYIGGLVNIGDRLAVELYDPDTNAWEICAPIPDDFRSCNSSQWLSAVVFKNKFYVFEIHTGCISSFDLVERFWCGIQTIQPHGMKFSFLIACRDRLILAGLCMFSHGISMCLWTVDEKSLQIKETAEMPVDLLYGLLEGDVEDKFASLKCVGFGNLIFVFNEEYHRNYPACVCEISSITGSYTWKRVPPLPSPVKHFHKVICFCSSVPFNGVVSPTDESSSEFFKASCIS